MKLISPAVDFAVEGRMDEEVVRALFRKTGVIAGRHHVCGGIDGLRLRLDGFNASAQRTPWFVLCDLDRRECPASLRSDFLKNPQAAGLQFRVAVRSIEAWFMADRKSFAEFLEVDAGIIPPYPEQLPNPKNAVMNLARKSRNRELQKALDPSAAGGVRPSVYTAEMIRYVQNHWSPQDACENSPSLKGAFQHCRAFAKWGRWL